MKSYIVFLLIFCSIDLFAQNLHNGQKFASPHQGENEEISEGLTFFLEYLKKQGLHNTEIAFYRDSIRKFSVTPKRIVVSLEIDSVINYRKQEKYTNVYAYIISHCIGHIVNNSPCDTSIYHEFNADFISGYLLKKSGIVSNEGELHLIAKDSLLQTYFIQRSQLRAFERYFALNKGNRQSELDFEAFIMKARNDLTLYQSNAFNPESLSFKCTLNNGTQFFVGFPNRVYAQNAGKFSSIGRATSLDTTFWYYWMQIQVGKDFYYMDNYNRVCDNQGKYVGKIEEIEQIFR